jgi:hypothetical protein
MVALYALAALALASTVLGGTYPFQFSSYSTQLTYSPAANGDAAAGEWNMTTTDTGVDQPNKQVVVGGVLYACANGAAGSDAPKVSYTFSGSHIRFVGFWGVYDDASAGSVGLVVDGGEETVFTSPDSLSNSKRPVYIAEAALDNARHTDELFVRSGVVSLSNVIVDLDFPDVP